MRVSVTLLLAIAFCAVACNETKEQKASILAMNTNEDTIQAHLRIYIDSCWNKQDTTCISRISTEKFTRNLNGIRVAGTKKEMQAHMSVFLTGFPDLHLTMEKFYVKGNTVFMHWSSSGTNTGVFGEIAATGKKVQIRGLSQIYFDDQGKIYEEEVIYNELSLLQQLGYTLSPPVLE